jgi:nitrite reductase/ring-hydroxylating ferredoxin subunit
METTKTVGRRFACNEGDLEPGTSMAVPAPGPESIDVALFFTEEGEYFATADSCTHEEWSLGEDSDLVGREVECPLHQARFDLRTGAALCFPASVALATFSVVIDDGKIYVEG